MPAYVKASAPKRAVISVELDDGTVSIISCDVESIDFSRDTVDIGVDYESGFTRRVASNRFTLTIEASNLATETKEKASEMIARKASATPIFERPSGRRFNLGESE